jgi:hypothetical protein
VPVTDDDKNLLEVLKKIGYKIEISGAWGKCMEAVMGTKNNPGTYDCYDKAEPDEPMFVLLGRDKYAPVLVWLWAAMKAYEGGDASKAKEAKNCSLAMIQWARDHGSKIVGIDEVGMVVLKEWRAQLVWE